MQKDTTTKTTATAKDATAQPKAAAKKVTAETTDAKSTAVKTEVSESGDQTRTLSTLSSETTALRTTSAEPQADPSPFTGILAPLKVVADMIGGLLTGTGLNSFAGTGPTVPAESPALWAVLAWVRRQNGQAVTGNPTATPEPTTSLDTGEPVTAQQVAALAAAAVNTPPTATPTIGAPNQTTGVITGTIGGSDVDGNPLTYTVTGLAPTSGTVSVNAQTGAFTYTPTQAARLSAGVTPAADVDAFTVSVSDGQATTAVTVNVTVLPAVISGPTSTTVGGNPLGVTVSATKIYVANSGTRTVSVIDRTTGVVTTISNVVSTPSGIALSPDGNRLYVSGNNAVSVINTANNAIVATITTNGGQSYGVAVAPNGQRVYVTNTGTNTVSVINTATNAVIANVGVGMTPAGLRVSPDGSRVYVANWNGNTVSVINTATNAVVGSPIAVGVNPFGVTFSNDGTRAYVTNFGSNSVTVINTSSTTPAVATTIGVGAQPFGLALSPDGSLLYVANGNDTVSVVDTRTSAVVRTVTVDTAPESNWHGLAVSPDGRQVYIADMSDAAVRVLTISRANTAPVAGTPTVGQPATSDGAVTGTLGFTDPDGDPLTYTVPTQPSSGTVTVTSTGSYTYKPTAAARAAAAQTPGVDTATFTVVASDGTATTNVSVTVPISPSTSGPGNLPPTVAPTVGTPNQSTGVITGTIGGADPNGNPLTYTVTGSAPVGGTVSLNSQTGAFTYTPTQAARLAAGVTSAADIDSFTVTVSDGQATTTVTINVPVLPATVSGVTNASVGSSPMGVVVSATKIYVANSASRTVSVIDRTSGAITTINNVVSTPTGIALSPDGTRAYVSGNNAVSVINTATNAVVATITTNGGQSYAVAVSPNGQRVYVTNTGTNRVSVINTATNAVIANVNVGNVPAGLSVSPDGARVYVANYGSNTVTVINTATNAVVGSPISVGTNPFMVAFSKDGTRAYVSNWGSNNVSVINTTTSTPSVISSIAVGANPFGLTVSPDGSLLYVANGNDTVSVINTRTNAVLNTLTVDSAPENNWHYVAVSPDGRQIYITDMADAAVRILTINRGNTAPLAGAPSVGMPSQGNGSVTGTLGFSDLDGDPLTYTIPTQPGSGTVSLVGGTYTYTPTAAARAAAAQTPGVDTATFSVVASDGQASTTVSITVPIAPADASSTPYLPFDMPQGPTDVKVFAHYVPWFPVSADNLPVDQDYYTVHYLNPAGEFGIHAAYGGYLRDRPLPRDPINNPDWKYLDILNEVNQAKSVGIDGFAVDIVAASQDETIRNLLRAAENTPGFSIMPTADMAGPYNQLTPAQFAAQMAPYLQSPGAYRLEDGRVVLGAFYAEAETPAWWNEALTTLRTTYGVNVAFVPTFLDAYNYIDSFAPITYGMGNWGARNPAYTDPDNTMPGSQVDLIDRAHDLGKIWMQPVAFQDNRPREGIYEESGNTETLENTWETAIEQGAEWVQLLTWNDYAEMTAMAPSVEHGYRLLDMQAYYISQYKYGTTPTVVRDAIYVSHRDQPAAAESTYSDTIVMQPRPGTPAPEDTVDVVVFATAPAVVRVNVGGQVSTFNVAAGRSLLTVPLQLGTVSVTMERNGVAQTTVVSPYTVTNTPYVQDLQYHIAGGLR